MEYFRPSGNWMVGLLEVGYVYTKTGLLIKKVLIWFLIIVNSLACINRKESESNNHDYIAQKDTFDILAYKVKEENFGDDNLNVKLKNLLLTRKENDHYNLIIQAEAPEPTIAKCHEYYMIVSIYPKDSEKNLLSKERRKYGFELWSFKLRKKSDAKLMMTLNFETKIKRARAITISILSYETKKKGMEVVLKDVLLSN